MERERLTRLLEEPGQVARQDLAGLATLTEKYPWFSSVQLLRTAGERQAGEVLFDETLRTTSAHLPSRAALFDLVNVPPERSIVEQKQPKERTPVQVIEIPRPPTAAPLPTGPVESAPPPLAVVLPEEEIPVASTEETGTSLDQALDHQIMEAAIASAYDLTWSEQTAPVEPRSGRTAEEITRPVPVAAPARRISPHTRLRFTEWLGTAEPTPSVPPPPASTGTSGDHGDWLRGPVVEDPVPPAVVTGPAPTDANALIDRFMHHETPDPTSKTSFYTPQKAAKRSLDDTAGLVTETLARIYEKQGNLPKAIEAYRRLALKYPEKGAYFAALQKALEDQSNA